MRKTKILIDKKIFVDYDIYRLYLDLLQFKGSANQKDNIIYIQTYRISYLNNRYKFGVRYLIDKIKNKIIYLRIDDEIQIGIENV